MADLLGAESCTHLCEEPLSFAHLRDFLILRLRERGIPFLRLNTEDYGTVFQVNLSLTAGDASYQIEFSDGRLITETDISAVYFRQPASPDISADIAESDRVFARREARELLRSLWRLIDRGKWLNHPKSLWLASNKVEQLTVAQMLGFNIPATCVSASEPTVRRFIETCDGRVICKAVKHGFLRQGHTVQVATTQRIGPEFLNRVPLRDRCSFGGIVPLAVDLRERRLPL